MSNERLSRALMEVGDGLGQMANVALSREREAADRLHQESMARLRHNLASKRDQASREFSSTEAEKDRTWRSTEANKDRTATASEREKDRDLTERRLDSADKRAVEQSARNELDAIDKRLLDLRDERRKIESESLGQPDPNVMGEIEQEMAALAQRRQEVNYRMIDQLAQMGDERFAGLEQEDMLRRAGYTQRQIDVLKQLESGGEQAQESGAIPVDEVVKRPTRRKSRSRVRELMQEAELTLAESGSAGVTPAKPASDDSRSLWDFFGAAAGQSIESAPATQWRQRLPDRSSNNRDMTARQRRLLGGGGRPIAADD